MGAACAAACCGWFLAKSRPLRFAWPAAVGDWWHNWSFARWALASHLIGFATPTIMPWIVTTVLGTGEAGAFAACVGVVGTASMFMTGLATYLIPKAALAFAEGGVQELRRVLRTATIIYASALGAFALLVLVTGDFLLVFAFGAKYAGYGTVVGILALSMVALSMNLTAGNLFADICTLVVTLTILVCLLHPLGLLGAALSDLGGKIVGALIRYWTLHRLLKTAQYSPAVR
jgi:O-antigen/teichoic acid export membrane protein